MTDKKVDAIIRKLETKISLTSLEKDILDTYREYQKLLGSQTSSASAKKQIDSNTVNHLDIALAIACMPKTVQKQNTDITADDQRYMLRNQLVLLCERELSQTM